MGFLDMFSQLLVTRLSDARGKKAYSVLSYTAFQTRGHSITSCHSLQLSLRLSEEKPLVGHGLSLLHPLCNKYAYRVKLQ